MPITDMQSSRAVFDLVDFINVETGQRVPCSVAAANVAHAVLSRRDGSTPLGAWKVNDSVIVRVRGHRSSMNLLQVTRQEVEAARTLSQTMPDGVPDREELRRHWGPEFHKLGFMIVLRRRGRYQGRLVFRRSSGISENAAHEPDELVWHVLQGNYRLSEKVRLEKQPLLEQMKAQAAKQRATAQEIQPEEAVDADDFVRAAQRLPPGQHVFGDERATILVTVHDWTFETMDPATIRRKISFHSVTSRMKGLADDERIENTYQFITGLLGHALDPASQAYSVARKELSLRKAECIADLEQKGYGVGLSHGTRDCRSADPGRGSYLIALERRDPRERAS